MSTNSGHWSAYEGHLVLEMRVKFRILNGFIPFLVERGNRFDGGALKRLVDARGLSMYSTGSPNEFSFMP